MVVDERSRLRHRALIAVPMICGILAAILYEMTNATGLFWGDAGEFIAVSRSLGIGHAYGHPLFWLAGRISILLRPANPAAAMNHLVSVVSGAACALVAVFVKDVLGKRMSASQTALAMCAVSGLYATATTVWMQATFVEVYNFQAFFIVLSLILFYRAYARESGAALVASAYFWGLSITMGLYAVFLIVLPITLWMLKPQPRRIRWRSFAHTVAGFIIGLSIWLYLPIRSTHESLFYWEKIVTFSDFFGYLARGQFEKIAVAGRAAIPLSLFQTAGILLRNFGIWGIGLILIGIPGIIRNRTQRLIPAYAVSTCVLILAFVVFLPLNLSFRQLVDMDVYFIPAFLMSIPILTIGTSELLRILKKPMRPLILIPILVTAGMRWGAVSISDRTMAQRFLAYLTSHIPAESLVFPVSDEVAHPLLYSTYALGNPRRIRLPAEAHIGQEDVVRRFREKDETVLIEINDAFLKILSPEEQSVLAGPFLASIEDSSAGKQLESAFNASFLPDQLDLKKLNRLDRLSLARLWSRRGVYWFHNSQNAHPNSERATTAFRRAVENFNSASACDDFSLEGALHASNLALTLIQGGDVDRAEDAANQALKLNPYAPETHRALYAISVSRKHFEDALRHSKILARLLPKDGDVRLNMAGILVLLNRKEEAEEYYREGIRLGAEPRKELEDYLFGNR